MFFRKKNTPSTYDTPQAEFRWINTEIYDKRGKDSKLLRTEKELEYRPSWRDPWNKVWNQYNTPIYLEDK